MVGMTFLGAVVVTRRNSICGWTCWSGSCRRWLRLAVARRGTVAAVVLAGFVLSQSYFYASQMLRIGRTSDMAGVPMWIPHGMVALGFGLILIVALWRVAAPGAAPAPEPGRPPARTTAMTFALAVVPVVLLLLGFPIFMVLLTAVTVALVFFMNVPLVGRAPEPVRFGQRVRLCSRCRSSSMPAN